MDYSDSEDDFEEEKVPLTRFSSSVPPPRISRTTIGSHIRLGNKDYHVNELKDESEYEFHSKNRKRRMGADTSEIGIVSRNALSKRLRETTAGGGDGHSTTLKISHPRPRQFEGDGKISAKKGPPGNEYSTPDSSGFLIGKRQTDPVPYQSSVVNIARFIRPAEIYADRKINHDSVKDRDADLVAPLGDLNAFVARIGDTMWSLRGDEPQGSRDTDAYSAFIKVFCASNGLLRTDDIIFQGVKLFDQNSDPARAQNPDDVGTLQVGGTITITNTGDQVIGVNEFVYGSMYPILSKDTHGNIIPKILVPGTSGSRGEPDMGRFLPATYSLKDDGQGSYLKSIEMEIRAAIEKYNPDSVESTEEAKTLLESAQYDIEQELFSRCARDLPARRYAKAYMADYLWAKHSQDDDTRQSKEIAEAILTWIQKLYRKHSDDSKEYHENLGAGGIGYTHPCLNPTIVAQMLDMHTWQQNRRSINKLTPASALSQWSGNLLRMTIDEQYNYLRTKGMGRSQHTIGPSVTFDIYLGKH